MAHRKSGHIFFMLACADQSGTEVLVRRIQGQLALCKNLQNIFPDYAVDFTIIEMSPEKDNIPFGHLVDKIAGNIESLMKEITGTLDRA
jgi:hypothetical protein